jgi:hypothetical protein
VHMAGRTTIVLRIPLIFSFRTIIAFGSFRNIMQHVLLARRSTSCLSSICVWNAHFALACREFASCAYIGHCVGLTVCRSSPSKKRRLQKHSKKRKSFVDDEAMDMGVHYRSEDEAGDETDHVDGDTEDGSEEDAELDGAAHSIVSCTA